MTTARSSRFLGKADPIKWPLQIQQMGSGWTVACYNKDGHARHLASAENEMQALRTALNMARAYQLDKRVLVTSYEGVVEKSLDKILKPAR